MPTRSENPVTSELTTELARLELQLPDEQVEKLSVYCRELWDHNSRLNLTRHTDYRTFVERDVLDSVQLASVIEQDEKILDFGSGGGVPGIVLGILRPDLDITLAECVGKKAHVLDLMTRELELPIDVIDDRAENVVAGEGFSSLTARAVGPLPKMLPWFNDCWGDFGRMLLIKGPRWTEERAAAEEGGQLKSTQIACVLSYPMPGRDSESVVLELRR